MSGSPTLPQLISDAVFLSNAAYASGSIELIPQLGEQGWTALDADTLGMGSTYFGIGFLDGNHIYDNLNAQAIVARKGTTLAISFRGTEASLNPLTYPEFLYDWYTNIVGGGLTGFSVHYMKYQPLIDAVIDHFNAGVLSGIYQKLLVTGHSQGGAIADRFMVEHGASNLVQGITLASPGNYHSAVNLGNKLINIAHSGDIVSDLLRTSGVDLVIDRTSGFSEHSISAYIDSINKSIGVFTGGQFQKTAFADKISTSQYYVIIRDEVDNNIWGSSKQEAIFSFGGADNVRAGAHDDLIDGGEGADTIYGGVGSDHVVGGPGNDFLRGESESDTLDGGDNEDTAIFNLRHEYYFIERIDYGIYRVSADSSYSSEDVDTLVNVERIRFADGDRPISDWLTMQNGAATPPAEPPPVVNPPPAPGPISSTLLSVLPINHTLRVGESVALSAIFPETGWIDNDGPRDIQWVYVQDRTAGGGYLTNHNVAMNANTVFTIPVSNLGNWRFVAGNAAGSDEIGFNIVQADFDYSPRLSPGAIVTTIPASTVTAPLDDHANNYESATVMSAGPVTNFVSALGRVGTASDQDWFSVQLLAGSKYAFVLWPNSTTNSLLDPRLTLRKPGGDTVTNDNLSATTLMSFISFTATQTGTHYLRAEGVHGTTGDYILTALPVVTDPTASGLGPRSGNVDPWSSVSWHWQGTPGNDSPSELTLESGGRPQTSGNNFYRGHDGDDRIRAGDGNDVVWGDDDEDRLEGQDGDDTLRGGRHDDTLLGTDGHDLLYGEDGDDSLSGGDGNDTLYADDEEDTLRGGAGDDYIKGEDDNDDIDGGTGNDQLYGDRGADSIEGGSGNDFMMGGHGNDVMDGDSGHDRLAGEDDDDFLFGDDGDDAIYGGDDDDTLQGGEGNDVLHGEDGIDTADFTDGDDGVRINLFDEIAVSTDLGTDTLYEIENIKGSGGDDVVDGDHGANVLDGYQANDNIRAHNGADTLLGGTGNDTLWGDLGNDVVNGDEDQDELRGGLGADTLYGSSGNDHLRGEQDNDTVDGGEGIDTVFFWGEREDFSIVVSGAGFTVADLRADGLEGQDFVTNIEFFEFFDGTVAASIILAGPPLTVNDEASTAAQTPIVLDVLQNDSAGGLGLELLSVQILAGAGTAYVAGNGVVFDPRGAFDHLVAGATATVNLAYVVRSEGLLTSTGALQLLVTSAQDRLVGDGSHNELYGYEGNDLLDGRAGNDSLAGGEGADSLFGDVGRDSLYGDVGRDSLNGGTGADTMAGGADGDAYVVDNLLDVVIEADTLAGAIDLVTSSVSFTLGANLERLVLSGGSMISGAGNTLANAITGNIMANTLSGLEGADTLSGAEGADSLAGGSGMDSLNGGAGADSMAGGTGNDSYLVDNAGDRVVEETASGANDLVTSWVSFSLGANIERLVLSGAATIAGTGNTLANVITGNGVANTLSGLEGADSLAGGSGADSLSGGNGADSLNGETGADSMAGGAGNDTFIVDNAGDRVIEEAGGGTTDLVRAWVSFSLGAEVERLVLAGAASLAGTGNGLDNVITGNSGANRLAGAEGNDSLAGGKGADSLAGGAGADSLLGGEGADTLIGGVGADSLDGGLGRDAFRFGSAAEGVDSIAGYVVLDDVIQVSASGFGGGLVGPALPGGFVALEVARFATGTLGATTTEAQRFIWDGGAKVLWWDADGSAGAFAPVQIARFTGAVTLDATEFQVIA